MVRAASWYFAEGSQGFFSTFLLLANSSAQPATVTVSFLTETNGTVQRTFQVAPTARLTVAAGLIPELVNRSFAMVVDSNVPIVAERAMYFGTARFWDGGHESAGVSEPSANWFLAEGATGSFFDTFILVANPNPTPTNVAMTFLTDQGQSIVRNYTVAANARLTVNMEEREPVAGQRRGVDDDRGEPADHRRARDVLAGQRRCEWTRRTTASASPRRARSGAWRKGASARTRRSRPTSCSPTRARRRRRRCGSPTCARPARRSSGPTRSTRRRASTSTSNGRVPELANESFGALIEVTNGVGIVVERSLYNDALGQVWAAGTNALGTRLP